MPNTGPTPTVPDDDLADAMSADVLQPDEGTLTADEPIEIYQPNIARLQAAGGDPRVWAAELYELIGHHTGRWVPAETVNSFFEGLATQVRIDALRVAMFQVANTSLPSRVSGDPAIQLLQLRDDLANGLRHSAGLA